MKSAPNVTEPRNPSPGSPQGTDACVAAERYRSTEHAEGSGPPAELNASGAPLGNLNPTADPTASGSDDAAALPTQLAFFPPNRPMEHGGHLLRRLLLRLSARFAYDFESKYSLYQQEGLTQTRRIFCACCTIYFALWLAYTGGSIIEQQTFRIAVYGLTAVVGLYWLVVRLHLPSRPASRLP